MKTAKDAYAYYTFVRVFCTNQMTFSSFMNSTELKTKKSFWGRTIQEQYKLRKIQ